MLPPRIKSSLLVKLVFLLSYVSMYPITQQEETDLELFAAHNNQSKSVFELIDRTRTKCGADALKKMMRNPITSIELLEQRQRCIQRLIEQPKLLAKLDNQLLVFRKHEDALQTFWQPEDAIKKLTLDEFYFSYDSFKQHNNSPSMLNALQVVHVGSMFAPVIEHMVAHYLMSSALKKKLGIHDCSDHGHDHDHKHDVEPTWWSSVLYKAYNVGHLTIHAIGIKALVQHIVQKAALIKNIQEQLIQAGIAIHSMQQMCTDVAHDQVIAKEVTNLATAQRLFDPAGPAYQVMDLLEKNTFKGDASYFSNIGNVLALQGMLKDATQVQEAVAFVGQLDTYVAIAKLYKEFHDKNVGYSFATYVNAQAPSIRVQDFWNPQVGHQACITNSLQLGDIQPTTAVITGPNAAGKSTTLRSMSLLVLFGQTLTIVPAQQVTFTPFTHIVTSMTHTDNVGCGNSLFTAELLKANQFVEKLNQCVEDNHFTFAVFDELFKSTAFEKGQQTAYSFINHLGSYQQCLTVVATHYPKLVALAEQEPTIFKNYVMQVDSTHKDRIVYRLAQGCADVAHVFDVLEQRDIAFDW